MKNITLVNFRDFGGLETPYGVFKKKKLYRAAVFSPKNNADNAFISAMNLDAVVDFRTNAEVMEKGDVLPDGVTYLHAPVIREDDSPIAPTKDSVKRLLKLKPDELDPMRQFIFNEYRKMPFSRAYDEVFALLDEGKTVAFHCTAGKDRTGICSILIESAFGRTLEQCKAEYLASNSYREKDNNKIQTFLTLTGVKKYMRDFVIELLVTTETLFDAAISAITEKYQTMEEFLEKEHDITRERVEKWKKIYLE